MIFLGDIACPDEKIDEFLSWTNSEQIFFDEVVIANLEANIVDQVSERRNLTLYNSSKISRMFSNSRKLIVSLANNHMYDYPQKILATKYYLEEKGIGCFGIYDKNEIKPYEYIDQDGK